MAIILVRNIDLFCSCGKDKHVLLGRIFHALKVCPSLVYSLVATLKMSKYFSFKSRPHFSSDIFSTAEVKSVTIILLHI